MSLSKALKKDEVKSVTKSKMDLNYNSNHTIYKSCKGYDKFGETWLDSKYNWMKKFNKLFISFKIVKIKKKTETQLRKKRIMKSINEKKKYYNVYKNGYDTNDELNEAKKKTFDHNHFKLVDKRDKELKLDEETKDLKLTTLPKWVSSKNDFNEATKLINDIRADTNNAKTSLGYKKRF